MLLFDSDSDQGKFEIVQVSILTERAHDLAGTLEFHFIVEIQIQNNAVEFSNFGNSLGNLSCSSSFNCILVKLEIDSS